MGIFDKVYSSSTSLDVFGSDTPLGNIGNSIINSGINIAKSRASMSSLPLINAGVSALNGDFEGAFNQVVNKDLFNRLLYGDRSKKDKFLAYHSLKEAQAIFDQVKATNHALKNVFLITISDYSGASLQAELGNVLGNFASDSLSSTLGGFVGNAAKQTVVSAISALNPLGFLEANGGGTTSKFNMLASGVSYTPFSIESDSFAIGSALADGFRSSAKSEISITTLDNEKGDIKRWFKEKASRIIHKDGTVGVLTDGLVEITILHAFASDDLGGFKETIVCRPVSTDYEFQRMENAPQEFTMRFEQTDTWL